MQRYVRISFSIRTKDVRTGENLSKFIYPVYTWYILRQTSRVYSPFSTISSTTYLLSRWYSTVKYSKSRRFVDVQRLNSTLKRIKLLVVVVSKRCTKCIQKRQQEEGATRRRGFSRFRSCESLEKATDVLVAASVQQSPFMVRRAFVVVPPRNVRRKP